MSAVTACAFDAYGTLFDVHSAVVRHADQVGPDAALVSRLWRSKQLEYTWVRSLMRDHADFWTCTEQALAFALASFGLGHRGDLKAALMDAYRMLAPYPEVRAMLVRLREMGVRTAILSNGTPTMLRAAVASAALDDLDLPIFSIEQAGIYKPDASVYRLASDGLGLAAERIAFLSANAWDVAGARAAGLRAVWVNRTQQPDEYGLAGSVPILGSLEGLPVALGRL
jgi:2-haloacid dehalogenase